MDSLAGTILKLFPLGGLFSYFSPAPFGRFSTPSRLSLPGRAGWIVQESVGPLVFLLHVGTCTSWRQTIAAGMFLLHYLNRALLFPLFVQPSYSPTHVSVVAGAMLWQLCMGQVQAHAVNALEGDAISPISPIRFLLALLLFAAGMAGNIYHDWILASIRRSPQQKTRYAVPQGGLFALISYPHYLLEWIEWTGYALLLGSAGNYAGAWFVLLEVCVMLPRALQGHAFYAKQGLVLPPGRRAIVPYLL